MLFNIIKYIFELVKTAAVMLLIAFIIQTFLIQTYIIDGISMEPNFHTGEYIIVDKISYKFSPPKRGEVVVFDPLESPDSYIKRIIGLPGESVKISNRSIYVDNKKLDEPYLSDLAETLTSNQTLDGNSYILHENEYFVLGDNRPNSKDSRSFGAIKISQIRGRALLVFYPFRNFHII